MDETLEIFIPKEAGEMYDESTNTFSYLFDDTTLQLKHSLLSLRKWECKWHKVFLDRYHEKTEEETKDYVKCMTINKGVNPAVYDHLPSKCLVEIKKYIEDPMTATWFSDSPDDKPTGPVPTQTSETIYADMIQLNIPVEFQKWHLNSLLTLIKVCAIRQQPPKKMSPEDTIKRYAELNRMHKAKNIK